jgi:hypothetical protein
MTANEINIELGSGTINIEVPSLSQTYNTGGNPSASQIPVTPTINGQNNVQSVLQDLDSRIGVSDKHYEYAFSNQTNFSVTHNLNKKPAVTMIDSAGTEIIGDYLHNSSNQITITLQYPTSGTAIFN